MWFRRNELRVHGYVAWVEGKHAGIAFSRALKAKWFCAISAARRRGPPTKLPHRRPALTRPGMSAEEQRWAEEILREPLRHRRAK